LAQSGLATAVQLDSSRTSQIIDVAPEILVSINLESFAPHKKIIEPDIVLTKIVEDDAGNDIGGQEVGLDTPLNYVIGFQNVGNDNATDFQIRDILPINIVYNHPTSSVAI